MSLSLTFTLPNGMLQKISGNSLGEIYDRISQIYGYINYENYLEQNILEPGLESVKYNNPLMKRKY